MDHEQKLSLIEKDHESISISRQTKLLGISRQSAYYKPIVDQEDIRIMARMDHIFTACPFYGSRRIRKALELEPYSTFIGREHVQHLMRKMGLEAIYPKKRDTSSDPNPGHKKYPYLLKNLAIERPNQVWGTDITYIPMGKGFCYLVALIDWYSRYVISWKLAETLEISFCIENIQDALTKAIPEIHNSDQGSHFTSNRYTDELSTKKVQISMDGRGRCMDNIFTERLWRTVKYENIYLHEYQTPQQVTQGLTEYFDFYNNRRMHQSLNYSTPAQIYGTT